MVSLDSATIEWRGAGGLAVLGGTLVRAGAVPAKGLRGEIVVAERAVSGVGVEHVV